MTPFSPSYDNKIAKKYSAKTVVQKVENKIALQKELGWKASKDTFLVCIPQGIGSNEQAQLIEELLPGILELGIQLLIVGKANRSIAEHISSLIAAHTNTIHIVPDEEVALRTMYAAADASIFLQDCSNTTELKNSLHYGTVPIALENTTIQNYNAIKEAGNSFAVQAINVWQVFAALVRAKETHQFPYDYRTIQRHCMATNAK